MGVDAGFKDIRPDASVGESEEHGRSREADLARDWITMWQSELNALAADPETVRTWQAMAHTWANFALWMLNAVPKAPPPATHDATARYAGTRPQTRPAPAAAAPDPRDAEVARLSRHIAELERRLADLEHGKRRRPASDPKRGRKRPV